MRDVPIEARARRATAAAVLLVLAALAAVVAISMRLASRDRAALEARFEADRSLQVEAAAQVIAADLEDIRDDLAVAAQLVQASDNLTERRRSLGALLAVVRQYLVLELLGPEGESLFAVTDPSASEGAAAVRFNLAIRETGRRALGVRFGEMVSSPPLAEDSTGWMRAFATPLPGGEAARGAVVLVVDTEPYFRRLGLAASGPTSKLLLLGAHGRPTPATDPAFAAAVARADQGELLLAGFTDLLARMRAGERGVVRLAKKEAEALGLGPSGAVAAFSPVPMGGGGRWALSTVSSFAELLADERASANRLLATAAAIAVLLIAFGFYVVVTSRREVATRERLRHAERLAHLHEKTEKILDQVPAGVMALSEDGQVTSVNRVLRERIVGEVVGKPLGEAFPRASPETAGKLRALVAAACEAGEARALRAGGAGLFGQEGDFSLHAVPLQPRFPEARVLLVVEDLSEVRSLTAQLMRAEKLSTVGVLAAGIAHEIGTPLSVVRARAEHTAAKLGEAHPQAAGLRVIVEQIDLVARTIRELLDFSRVRSVAPRSVVLAPVARAVADLLRFEAQRRKVSVEVGVAEELPRLAADPDQLQQALVNLVMNACDACEVGGKVQVRARPEPGEMVRIEVSDDGCGIAEEHRNQVFDPFFTTKKRGQGTGLGLTVVAQIARSHGVQVELESRPGRGTRVSLQWPAAPPAPEESADGTR